MGYEKTIWQSGDTITAEKLNNMESGIEDSRGYEYSVEPDTDETLFSNTYTTFSSPEEPCAVSEGSELEKNIVDVIGEKSKIFVDFYNDNNEKLFEGEVEVVFLKMEFLLLESEI